MACDHCTKETQLDNFFNLVGDILGSIKSVSDEEIANALLYHLKLRLVPKHDCYYHLLGLLTDMMQQNLFEMWCEMHPEDKEEKE